MNTLSGKIALVTGGSRGIGAGIAKRLAQEGCDVAITFVSSEGAAAKLVEDIEAMGKAAIAIKADGASPPDIIAAVDKITERFGRIDILVNNNGHMDRPDTTLEDITLQSIDQNISINLRSAFLYAQYTVRQMPPGGRIINIGSCLSRRVPSPGFSLYAMTKAGLTGLTKGLARDLGPRGITVNEISPGPIDTDMNPATGPSADFQRSLTAIGRYGTPSDIAAVVCFLAGDHAAFITGTNLAVDGGTNV
ncbi:MAG: 3-oxoacyl-ACP reductase FabG [Alphaproteobacteria bacterium]|nr:3-oxoacyl-ACP reductase FabG [Alphaproteobacteria bacterium]MBU2229948.1 3-oxoacyl-ACP reductase FabG [Alphaproteobacteria bacterium]